MTAVRPPDDQAAAPPGKDLSPLFAPVLAWLARGEQWLFGLRFGHFIVLVLALAVLRNGVWFVPSIELVRAIAVNPCAYPPVIAANPHLNFLMDSFLGPWLAWCLRLNGNYLAFGLMHLAIFLVFFPLLLWQARRRFGDFFARALGIAFVVLPVSTTVLTWLGYSDVFTFLVATTFFVGRSALLMLAVGFLMGVNHFEQGLVLLAFTGAAQWSVAGPVQAPRPQRLVWAGLGLVLGKTALYLWFLRFHIPVALARLAYPGDFGVLRFWEMFLVNLPALVFSLFNVFWVVVLVLGAALWRGQPRRAPALAALSVLALGVTTMALDMTRVFALISWPVVLAFLLLALQVHPEEDRAKRRLLTAVLAGGLLVPPLMVWEGRTHSGVLFHTFWLLYELVTGGFALPPNPFSHVPPPFE